MGNFSRDTFDRLKHYVGVRLQQGVPIVDADWNELEDIRKYELRAFLKWFVGDGIPQGNDGFRIAAIADLNDFEIKGGDDTAEGAGHCLVDGWDVINESALKYSEQQLHADDALADAWGVAHLDPLTTPGADHTGTVYLDVWEREVDSAQDSDLVNPAIGLETCVRLKREWVVRVREEIGAPALGDPDYQAGHSYYALAAIARRSGDDVITADDITDLRLTGLSVISYYDVQQIMADAYGPTYTLDHDGQPNLKVSLREAINAMLRGGLPSTPEMPLTTDAAGDWAYTALEDSVGDIWVFWHSYRSGNSDIWYKRYERASDSWQGDTQLTTNTDSDSSPFAIEDSVGDVWVFWSSDRNGNTDIWYNRYERASDSWQGDTQLTTYADADRDPFAIEDSVGDLWVFWRSYRSGNYDIRYNRYERASDSWQGDTPLTTDADADYNPFAIEDNVGDLWVFWRSYRSGSYDIWYQRYNRATDSWEWSDTQLTTTGDADDYNPFAIKDSVGDIWAFWESYKSGSSDIWCKRFSRDSGWGRAVQLTATPGRYNYLPLPLEDSSGDIWVFWTGYLYLGSYDIWYKKLIPAI